VHLEPNFITLLYFGVLLHWLTIYSARAVFTVHFLVVFVDCCVLSCNVFLINVTSTYVSTLQGLIVANYSKTLTISSSHCSILLKLVKTYSFFSVYTPCFWYSMVSWLMYGVLVWCGAAVLCVSSDVALCHFCGWWVATGSAIFISYLRVVEAPFR
jgi:hypothetical protein